MEINLTQNKISLVSREDYKFISSYKWHVDSKGYAINKGLGRLHRLIMVRKIGKDIPIGLEVDHVNRNKLDNRRVNLRLVTPSQNRVNSDKNISASGYRGVTKRPGRNRWNATINKDSKKMYIGSFETKEEAARAYNKKAKELYGNFAYLNKVKKLTL